METLCTLYFQEHFLWRKQIKFQFIGNFKDILIPNKLFESFTIDVFSIFRFYSLITVICYLLRIILVNAVQILLIITADISNNLFHEGSGEGWRMGRSRLCWMFNRRVKRRVLKYGDRTGWADCCVMLGNVVLVRHVHLHHQAPDISNKIFLFTFNLSWVEKFA